MYIFKVLLNANSFSQTFIHQSVVYLHVLSAFVVNVSLSYFHHALWQSKSSSKNNLSLENTILKTLIQFNSLCWAV